MKRIVILAEGHGEARCAGRAVSKVLTDNDRSAVFLDENVIRTGEVGGLLKDHCEKWLRLSMVAQKRESVGGLILLLDADRCSGCPVDVAKKLTAAVRPIAERHVISVCPVFAVQEYESWLLLGLSEVTILPDGRRVAPADANIDYEMVRGSKERLKKLVQGGYRPTRDQLMLTDAVNWDVVRDKSRSYRRLISAVSQIVEAVKFGSFVVSPASDSDRSQ